MLYLSICFFILPALGSILKIRKRKLAQVSSHTESSNLPVTSSFAETTKPLLMSFNTKFINLVNGIGGENHDVIHVFTKSLGTVSIKFEVSREYNADVFAHAQRVTLLHG
jgi:hypothetical protein